MLDLVPFEETAAAKAKARGGDIWVTHRNIDDVSLYEKYGRIRRVPIEAMTSTPDLTPTGEVIREIVEPQRMDDFHALQNTATGGLLNVRPVGKSYALVPHDGLFKAQAMDMFNSVDMSWALQIFSGAYRDLCRNTLVFGGEKAYHQRKVHRGAVSPEAMIAKATMGLSMWQDQRDVMDRWRNAALTQKQFADILRETICRKNTKAAETDERLAVNERRLNWLLERFEEERRELGHTLWAGYNALTHWATHLPDARDRGRAERKRYTRNDQVRAIVEGPQWQYLEGLAQ